MRLVLGELAAISSVIEVFVCFMHMHQNVCLARVGLRERESGGWGVGGKIYSFRPLPLMKGVGG